jgi:hypothetical protein
MLELSGWTENDVKVRVDCRSKTLGKVQASFCDEKSSLDLKVIIVS